MRSCRKCIRQSDINIVCQFCRQNEPTSSQGAPAGLSINGRFLTKIIQKLPKKYPLGAIGMLWSSVRPTPVEWTSRNGKHIHRKSWWHRIMHAVVVRCSNVDMLMVAVSIAKLGMTSDLHDHLYCWLRKLPSHLNRQLDILLLVDTA